jgi:hypothetical protein
MGTHIDSRGCLPENSSIERAGIEKRVVANAGLGADRARSFVDLGIEVLCIDRFIGKVVFEVAVAAQD